MIIIQIKSESLAVNTTNQNEMKTLSFILHLSDQINFIIDYQLILD